MLLDEFVGYYAPCQHPWSLGCSLNFILNFRNFFSTCLDINWPSKNGNYQLPG